VALSVKFDQGYVSQFSAVRGNGLMLLNHNIEGDGWYSLLQGKLVFLNAMLTEIRSNERDHRCFKIGVLSSLM